MPAAQVGPTEERGRGGESSQTAPNAREYRRSRRLARGRVSEAQRLRIVSVMIDLVREQDAEAVAISEVVSRARVSRRTFYELFEDRSDCLIAAVEGALELAGERARVGYDERGLWIDRVREGLLELLCFLDEEPRLAWLLIVRSAAIGPDAMTLRAKVIRQLAEIVDEGREDMRAQPPGLTAEAVVGGIVGVIHSRLLKPDPGPLVELLNPLMSMIALPYHGTSAAHRELARPRATRRARSRAAGRDRRAERDLRLTARTLAVLRVVAAQPGLSNREVAVRAGIADQGQTSRLLGRLRERGLLENTGAGQRMGAANAWRLTNTGERVAGSVRASGGGT
jgi:AcrR family transcriptional regulator